MKKTLRQLSGIFITSFLIICGVSKLGYLLRPVKTDIATNTIDTFHHMPKNSFEVIGYGSSHIWRGMSSMELYAKYGIGSYN